MKFSTKAFFGSATPGRSRSRSRSRTPGPGRSRGGRSSSCGPHPREVGLTEHLTDHSAPVYSSWNSSSSSGGRSRSIDAGPRYRHHVTSSAAQEGHRSRSSSAGPRPRYVAPVKNGQARRTRRAVPRQQTAAVGELAAARQLAEEERYVKIERVRAPAATLSSRVSAHNRTTVVEAVKKEQARRASPPASSDGDAGYEEFLSMLGPAENDSAANKREPPSVEPSKLKIPTAAPAGCPVARNHGDSPTSVAGTGGCPVAHSGAAKAVEKKEEAKPGGGQCPFKHGTVYSGPYPGYVHGNPNRAICPHGCRPALNSDILSGESRKDTLLREALEYLELYYHERSDDMKGAPGFVSKEERIEEVTKSVMETGTYEHTFDELQHGARVAWRNAPKCSNRKYWGQLKLLDKRDVTTNKGMFDACIQHLAKAMECGSSEAYITVFRPAPPGGEVDGPRIWNDQLLQYAAYRNELALGEERGDMKEVTGDPKNLRFTEMLKERFGWDGPPDGQKGDYDYLPLVVQADPNEPPELFDVPLECARPVFIHHPQYPELSGLGMRWYPIPAVSALDMTLGGIVYTAVPFNGWYASTEVLRDLTDESRYNMLVPVAEALGMDADTKPGEAPLWIDDVMAILSKAVYHSFKTAKIATIDHHTLISMFWTWYHDELKHRGYCPTNWKWVIPPMSSSTSPAYLGLNKAMEYTLKPAYIVGKGFVSLEERHFGPRDTTKAMKGLLNTIYLAILFKRMINRCRGRKQPVLVIYASVTGNASKYASDLGAILRSGCNVSFFDACGVNAADDTEILTLLRLTTLVIFVTSTQGNGELPSLSEKFFSFLFEEKGHMLKEKECAVLGFGSSAYPIFCGAAAHLSTMLAQKGAKEIIQRGECDAVKGEAPVFYKWAEKLVDAMASMPSASTLVHRLSENIKENTASVLAKKQNMTDSVAVEVFTSKEVESAAAHAFMRRKGGNGGQRRGSVGHTARRLSVGSICSMDEAEATRQDRIIKIISNTSSDQREKENDLFAGIVTHREDLISSKPTEGESRAVTRKTSLVKINLEECGNPPYQPGDHIKIIPRNVVSTEDMRGFIHHLSGNLELDDNIYVSLKKNDMSSSELAVSFPLLSESLRHMISLDHFFEKMVALLAPISMQACKALATLATTRKDQAILTNLGEDAKEYEKMNSMTGLKWIDLFNSFPSLSGQVTLSFVLVNMKMNHPRSYSISSCKAVVGSEVHITVGRYVFSRGGTKKEAGICSSYLTSVEEGDEVEFKLESCPSFHHPIDPSCPIIFICTGTGFAPIRGLLQKRSYFRSRGEKLGPSYLIFGSRSSEERLFEEEIREHTKAGVISKTFMCYSRESGKPKEYTTDKMKSDRVKRLLAPLLAKSNTHIFICGSANMADKSKSVLKEISSEACIENMAATGRLHCDVFGALNSNSNVAQTRRSRVAVHPVHGSVVYGNANDMADLLGEEDESEEEKKSSDLDSSDHLTRQAKMMLGQPRKAHSSRLG